MATKISDAVIRRLPRYYRQLGALQQEGVAKISSLALSAMMNVTASQIRQDLNCFGGFGQQGYGYNVSELRRNIAEILGINRQYSMIIIGAGNIGQALSNYTQFGSEGYDILALFDANPELVGKEIGGVQVHAIDSLEQFASNHTVDLAVVAVPAPAARAVAERLVKAGINAIWNFAPVEIVIEGVVVENAQLTDGLMALTYRLGKLRKEPQS
jgi:redox-sensing transcriptional repressor